MKKQKLKKVAVQESCGCCYSILRFKSYESAKQAFDKAGLTLNATITDDTGKTFNDIDTFYGMVKVTRENEHEYK